MGDDANRRLVKRLASKRVDTVPALFDVFFYHAMQLGLSADKFKIAKEIPLDSDRTTYRVGVPIKDALRRTSLIAILDLGFASLKADGTLKKIKMKYGIQDG
jgi:ABC-type amino acid transport substrate-binding protein